MNKHDNCPHCRADLNGELIIDTFKNMGKTDEEALASAKQYSGWGEYGVNNRWGRQIAIYDIDKDRTVKYKCPDCGQTWERQ